MSLCQSSMIILMDKKWSYVAEQFGVPLLLLKSKNTQTEVDYGGGGGRPFPPGSVCLKIGGAGCYDSAPRELE